MGRREERVLEGRVVVEEDGILAMAPNRSGFESMMLVSKAFRSGFHDTLCVYTSKAVYRTIST